MRILLVDDHKMMRDGLRAVLEQAGMEVVGDASNGRAAVALALCLHPEVVIMDVSMPDLNGIDATRQIVATVAGAKVIGLSMHSDRRLVLAMFKAGAVGYLLKSAAADELLQAVRAVAGELVYLSPSVASAVMDYDVAHALRPAGKAARPLSPREREVLQLLAEGDSSKDIAHHLDIEVTTVETHRRQIMDKLTIRSIAELTKYAIREGLTSVD